MRIARKILPNAKRIAFFFLYSLFREYISNLAQILTLVEIIKIQI